MERKLLRERLKSSLQELEGAKVQKDSYAILLKVLAVKVFMQRCGLRRALRTVYQRTVYLTTDMLMEQKSAGGGGGGSGGGEGEAGGGGTTMMLNDGGRAGAGVASVQSDDAEQLLVRNQQKMNRPPWNGPGGGGGFALRPFGSPTSSSSSSSSAAASRSNGGVASAGATGAPSSSPSSSPFAPARRVASLRSLVVSLEDELGLLVAASEGVVLARHKWQETAESFFQRNIELTQVIAANDKATLQSRAEQRELQRELGEARRGESELQSQLTTLMASHRSKLAELSSAASKSSSAVRQRRGEAEQLFARSVELHRRLREGEVAASELAKKETRLNERNDVLLLEQKKLLGAISQLKEIEASLTKSNAHAFAVMTHSAGGLGGGSVAASASARQLRHGGSSAMLGLPAASAESSSTAYLPLVGASPSPSQAHLLRPNGAFAAQQNNFLSPSPSPPGSGSTASLHGPHSPHPHPHPHPHPPPHTHAVAVAVGVAPAQLSRTMPTSSSQANFAAASSTDTAATAAAAAAVRPRPPQQPPQPQPQPALSPAQWAALSTLPPHLLPLTARPPAPPQMAPSSSTLTLGRGGTQTARSDKSQRESLQQRHAHKQAIAAALHRDSLDRALFRAAKAGLGRSASNNHSRKSLPARTSAPAAAGSTAPSITSAPLSFANTFTPTTLQEPLTPPPEESKEAAPTVSQT